jgi:putative spermidine/putrescine transport system permease protein
MSLRRISLGVVGTAIAFYFLAPILVIVIFSLSDRRILTFPPTGLTLDWYVAAVTDPNWTVPIVRSLVIAAATIVSATLLGTLAALALTRGGLRGARLIGAVILAPLIVPTIVVAVGLYLAYAQIQLHGTYPGFVLAHTALALPYATVSVAAGLRTIRRSHELAASSLGASPAQTFRFITLPAMLPSVMVAALLSFAIAWDETVVSIFLSTPRFKTLPVAIWENVRETVEPMAAAISTILIVVASFTLLIAYLLRSRTSGS